MLINPLFGFYHLFYMFRFKIKLYSLYICNTHKVKGILYNYLFKGSVFLRNKKVYYVSGNTAEGLVNYLQSNLEQVEHIVVLQHGSSTIKTLILEKLMNDYIEKYDVEVIESTISPSFVEGFIVRSHSLAIITDTIIDNESTMNSKVINIQTHLENKEIHDEQKQNKINQLKQSAYTNLATALNIHDELESIYINEMDFNKADEIAKEFIRELLKDVKPRNHQTHIYHRLFGTNTGEGTVNVVPDLLNAVNKRYYIKGRAGTGKSFFMNKVAKACENYGLHLELYHCSFDPESIDMVLIPELDVCLFDSTDPHEFFPACETDVVIDLYEEAVKEGTDERYKKEIQEITNEYKAYTKKAKDDLKQAFVYESEIEEEYMKGVTTKIIEQIAASIYLTIE